MGSLVRFLWAFYLSLLVLLSASAAAGGDGFAEIRVCVRDPRLKPTVGEWVYSMSSSDILTTTDEARFRSQSEGKTRFIYDPAAPESNNIFLPIPYHKLKCPAYVLPVKPKAPPPQPPKPKEKKGKDEGGDDDEPAPAAKKRDKAEGPPPKPKPQDAEEAAVRHQKKPPRERKPEEEVLPQAKVLPPPERLPEQKPALPVVQKSRKPRPMVAACGECKPKKPGKKPREEKTKADEIGQEMAIAAAIATMQMNDDLNRPDGKKNGIIGGKNPDGTNLPAAQIAASAVLMATVAAQSALFKKALKAAIKKGTPLIVKTLEDLSEEAAKRLATKHGAAIADALNKVGGIGPYKLWRKFTAGQGGQWQAHHILERNAMEKWGLGDPDLAPSVILTKAQHEAITAKLSSRTKTVTSPEQLWEAYKDVYKKNPEWLDAIRSYFEKGK